MVADDNNTTPGDVGDYIGFIPDLIQELSTRVGFTYEFYLSPDGRYGWKKEGKWTGMLAEVIKWKVRNIKVNLRPMLHVIKFIAKSLSPFDKIIIVKPGEYM